MSARRILNRPRCPRPRPAATDIRTFDVFLAEIRAEALTRGIAPATLDAAFTGLVQEPVVVARDRAQPEATLSLEHTPSAGPAPGRSPQRRTELKRHAGMLERVEASYGVPPAVVVAIWGLESNFGRFTGTYPTVKALATLAYDGRRPLFRRELFHALAILERGDVSVERLKGSWAGAMGQPQFMPSSYLEHAVDFDGDGRTDIWTSTPDVFGSMANYLRNAGLVGRPALGARSRVPPATLRADRSGGADAPRGLPGGARAERTAAAQGMAALGVTLPGGSRLPSADVEGSLVRGARRYFLVYRNYEALLAYNCSNAYARERGTVGGQDLRQVGSAEVQKSEAY